MAVRTPQEYWQGGGPGLGLTPQEYWQTAATDQQGLVREQQAADAAGDQSTPFDARKALEVYRNLKAQGFQDDQIERAFARHNWPMPPTGVLATLGRAAEGAGLSSLGSAAEGLGATLHVPGLISYGQGLEQEAAQPEYATGVSDTSDIDKFGGGFWRTADDVMRYGASMLGSSAPESLAIAGAAGLGALATPAAPLVAGGTAALAEGAAAPLIDAAIPLLGSFTTKALGSGLAAFGTAIMPNIGRNVQEQIDQGAAPQDVMIGGDAYNRALGAGAGQALLDTFLSARLETLIEHGLFRSAAPKMVARILKEAAIGATIEGTTEAMQEALQIYQADPSIQAVVGPAGRKRLFENFVGGAAIGGLLGGMAGVLPHPGEHEPEPPPPGPPGPGHPDFIGPPEFIGPPAPPPGTPGSLYGPPAERGTTVGPIVPPPGAGTPPPPPGPQERAQTLRNRQAGAPFTNIPPPGGPPSTPQAGMFNLPPGSPGLMAQGRGLEGLLPQDMTQAPAGAQQGVALHDATMQAMGVQPSQQTTPPTVGESTRSVLDKADDVLGQVKSQRQAAEEIARQQREAFDKQFPQVGQPAPTPATAPAAGKREVIGPKEFIAGFTTEGPKRPGYPHIDNEAAGAALLAKVTQALSEGRRVIYHVEGKDHPIVGVSQGMLRDREGLPWGYGALLFTGGKDPNHIIIEPATGQGGGTAAPPAGPAAGAGSTTAPTALEGAAGIPAPTPSGRQTVEPPAGTLPPQPPSAAEGATPAGEEQRPTPPAAFTPTHIDTQTGQPVQLSDNGKVRTVRYSDAHVREERSGKNADRYKPLAPAATGEPSPQLVGGPAPTTEAGPPSLPEPAKPQPGTPKPQPSPEKTETGKSEKETVAGFTPTHTERATGKPVHIAEKGNQRTITFSDGSTATEHRMKPLISRFKPIAAPEPVPTPEKPETGQKPPEKPIKPEEKAPEAEKVKSEPALTTEPEKAGEVASAPSAAPAEPGVPHGDRTGFPHIGTGMVLRTKSGRLTAPAPTVNLKNNATTNASRTRMHHWLLEEGRKEVAGDEHMTQMLKGMRGDNLSPADVSTLNELLFGDEDGAKPGDVVPKSEIPKPGTEAEQTKPEPKPKGVETPAEIPVPEPPKPQETQAEETKPPETAAGEGVSAPSVSPPAKSETQAPAVQTAPKFEPETGSKPADLEPATDLLGHPPALEGPSELAKRAIATGIQAIKDNNRPEQYVEMLRRDAKLLHGWAAQADMGDEFVEHWVGDVDQELRHDLMAELANRQGPGVNEARASGMMSDVADGLTAEADRLERIANRYREATAPQPAPAPEAAGAATPEGMPAATAPLPAASEEVPSPHVAAPDIVPASPDHRPSDEGQGAANAPAATEGGAAGPGTARPGGRGKRSGRPDAGGAEEPVHPGEGAGAGAAGNEPSLGTGAGGGTGLPARGARGRGKRTAATGESPNYLAPEGALTRTGSWRSTASNNLDVVELVQKLAAERRQATPEEQATLAKFTGWGASEIANKLFPSGAIVRRPGEETRLNPEWWGFEPKWKPLAERASELLRGEELEQALRSTQYAHYTSEPVIRGMWAAMGRFGFTGGKILEPGMGIGLFPVLGPAETMANSGYTGIEYDRFTADIARQLLPNENVLHADYVKQKLPDGFFDIAIGNPPFSATKITEDPAYRRYRFSLHDYFFAKSLDKVRPGGILAFVTSRYSMDKLDDKARQYIGERADLIGAIRLPKTAFMQNAGTEVVTDIIFLRRRQPHEARGGEEWMGHASVQIGDHAPVLINEYFVKHPEMVLGEHSLTGSMYRDQEYTVEARDGDIGAQLGEAIARLPADTYQDAVASADQSAREDAVERDFSVTGKKEGQVYLDDKGRLHRFDQGSGVPLDQVETLKPSDVPWLTGAIKLKDLAKDAQKAQLEDDPAWETKLKALNRAYDEFVKTHGRILDSSTFDRTTVNEDGEKVTTTYRKFKNRKRWELDIEGQLLPSLENINDEGHVTKSAFLTQRTLRKPQRPDIKTTQDAFMLSMDERGRLDLDHIAALRNISRDQVIEDLGHAIYETPQGEWQTGDEYLSGDVVAKLAEAREAAKLDDAYKRNVTALQERQPAPLTSDKIDVGLGAGWVPTDVIDTFAKELEIGLGEGKVSYEPSVGKWDVPGSELRINRQRESEWGTADRSPAAILESVLNNRVIKVTRSSRNPSRTWTDETATAQANQVAKNMRERFKSWVWTDVDRARRLLDIYNNGYNNLAPREFDGSHLTLPGLSLKYQLHPHQKRAVWRILQTGNTYLAHAVGAGKTLEMIVSAMEQRRLGLIKKPMFVVPKHMLQQFASEFMDAYPAAKIMVADDQSFHTTKRQQFVARASLNDLDGIIIPHSSMTLIGTKEETRAGVVGKILADLQTALDSLGTGQDTRIARKKIEQQIENVERRFSGATSQEGKDQGVLFEDLGVDFMYVDEAHEFRKLDFATDRQVKGIDPDGSLKALDLFVKTRWLEDQRPGRSMVFASGTPVTNTMAELYTAMRYLNEQQLEKDGLGAFDAWAQQFGEVATNLEPNAAGVYEPVSRFNRFLNVPELMKRVRSFMDVLTSSQLRDLIKVPDMEGGGPINMITPASADQRVYMDTVILPRIEQSRAWKPSREQPGNPDPMINIITDGQLSAIDMRFVDPSTPNDPNSKLNKMIDEIIATHQETKGDVYTDPKTGKKDQLKGSAQIVFSALGFGDQVAETRGFDVRRWMMQRFAKGGIPASEVAWMSDFDSDAKKQAIFKDLREGRKRILIGSPKNMGTGLNVQKRLKALHFLTPPWYPSDVEQPHGRIIRQGNLNPEVTIKWYATKGTYDSTKWAMVAKKAGFIEQAFRGDDSLRRIEDMSETSQYEMASAMAAGDERAIKLAQLNGDIERLELLQRAHHNDQIQLANRRDGLLDTIKRRQKTIARYKQATKGWERVYTPTMTVAGADYDSHKAMGEAILRLAQSEGESWSPSYADEKKGLTVGSFMGKYQLKLTLDLTAIKTKGEQVDLKKGAAFVISSGDVTHQVANVYLDQMLERTNPTEFVKDMQRWVNSLPGEITGAERDIREANEELAKVKPRIGAPFELAGEMAEKTAERARLIEDLKKSGEAAPDTGLPLRDQIETWEGEGGFIPPDPYDARDLPIYSPLGRDQMSILENEGGLIPDDPNEPGDLAAEMPALPPEPKLTKGRRKAVEAKGEGYQDLTPSQRAIYEAQQANAKNRPKGPRDKNNIFNRIDQATDDDTQYRWGEVWQPLTPRAFKQRDSLIRTAHALSRQMNPGATFSMTEKLFAAGPNLTLSAGTEVEQGRFHEILGSYDSARKLITVSLNANDMEVMKTTAHEAWHSIEDLLTDGEKAILNKAYPASGLRSQLEEVAYAFESWAGDRFSPRHTPAAKAIFAKVMRFLRALGNMLRGRGFKSVDDIFRSGLAGEIAARSPQAAIEDSFDQMAAGEGTQAAIRPAGIPTTDDVERIIGSIRDQVAKTSAERELFDTMAEPAIEHMASAEPYTDDEGKVTPPFDPFAAVADDLIYRLTEQLRDMAPEDEERARGQRNLKLGRELADRIRGLSKFTGVQFRTRPSTMPDYVADPNPHGLAGVLATFRQARESGVSRAWVRFQHEITDQLAALKARELRHQMDQGLGKVLPITRESAGKLAMLAQYDEGRMQVVMETAPLVLDRASGLISYHRTIGGLKWVAESLKTPEDYADATAYAYALRAQQLLPEDREHLMTPADIAAGLARGTPAARQFVARWEQFNDAMLQLAVDTGLLSADQKAAYQQYFYIPFYRMFEETGELMAPNELRRGLSNPTLGIRRLTGGTAQLGDLFENIVRNTAVMVSAVPRNMAMKASYQLLTDVGEAHDVPAGAPKGDDTVSFYEDGRRKWFRVDDPLIHAELSAIRPEAVNSIMRGMRKFASMYRRGITATPPFMLRNWIKGILGTWVQTGRNVSATGNTFTGMHAYWSGDPIVNEIRAATGFGGYGFGEAGGMKGRHLSRLVMDQSTFGKLGKALDWWEKVGEGTEMADRVALAQNMIAAGMDKSEALFSAYHVMPYGQRGAAPWLRFLTMTVPFLNARIQGLARLIDGTTNADVRQRLFRQVMLRGLLLSGFTAALWAINNSDPDRKRKYEAMTPDQRLTYWPLFMGPYEINIPKPYEFGHVFGTAIEMALDAATKDAATAQTAAIAYGAYHQTFGFDTYVPMPQALLPAFEVATNWDFWRQRPIENLGVSRLPPEQRTGPQVSTVAEALAPILSKIPGVTLSPLQLDHLIQGYFGILGKTITAGTDAVAGGMGIMPNRPAGVFGGGILGTIASTAGLESLVRDADVQGWNRWVEDFYQVKTLADEQYAGVLNLARQRRIDEARALVQQNPALLGFRPVLDRADVALSRLNQASRVIRASNLTAEQKKAKLDPITKQRNQIAENIMRIYNRVQARAA